MLLRVNNLCIDVIQNNRSASICKHLNFTIHQGETLGILGESGSGKAISVLSILQLIPPSLSISCGNIFFTSEDGSEIDLTQLSAKALQSIRGNGIAMVFQEPMSSLNPVFTCGEQVGEILIRHKISKGHRNTKERVLGLFRKVKLSDPERIFNSYPHQLSGGQKQRVMIAMAISCNPRLLIADEPTTALDVTVQKSILELLKELQSDMGMSILFITHDISVITEIAQRVLVFYKGEIVEQGDVKKLFANAEHPYTRKLLACRLVANRPLVENLQVLLSVQNMDVSFYSSDVLFGKRQKKQILHQINFDVFKGETLGLVGESGSGKTTIGRTIMKLIEAERGCIFFRGKLITSTTQRELKEFRKKVQIIFQDPYSSLNPKITVGEIIAEPLIVHNLCKTSVERKKRVFELLQQVNLNEEHYNRYPHQFSGGQRQRIGIARALAVEPELIILDESVSALDVSIQAQVLTLLNHLKKKLDLTYIFISHDLNTMRYMSDRMIVLKDGRIVEEGIPDALFRSPKNEYTAKLIEAVPGVVSNKSDT
jgi:peptide/nickel transport system ATP-binding protein